MILSGQPYRQPGAPVPRNIGSGAMSIRETQVTYLQT
jgi:hypothetical protein